MMSLSRSYILKALFFLLILFAEKASADSSYVEVISSYYKKMSEFTSPKENRIYYLSYTEEIIPHEDFSSSNKSEVRVYASATKLYYYTGVVDLFRDGDDSFLIVHKEKMIYRSNTVQNEKAADQFSYYLKIQDKFFKEGKVLLSEKIKLNGKNIARVTIQVPSNLDPRLKIIRTTYWYDLDAKKLWKTKVDYDESYQIKSRVTTYHELDLEYKKKLKKPVFKVVVDRKGKLVAPYETYTLVENK